MKKGMDKFTGKLITGIDYLRQRFVDAISTDFGELVVDRTYGAQLDDLIDHNITDLLRMKIFSRVAAAIRRPINGLDDIRLQQLTLEQVDNTVIITASVTWRDARDNQPINLQTTWQQEAA